MVDDEGNQLGIMGLSEALAAAQERGLDLVEVSPNAVPPVCRIMDYGKYKYETSKKAAEAVQFHVWPVATVDEALELLTGVPAGQKDASGEWPSGSLNRRVDDKLAALAEKARSFGRGAARARDGQTAGAPSPLRYTLPVVIRLCEETPLPVQGSSPTGRGQVRGFDGSSALSRVAESFDPLT